MKLYGKYVLIISCLGMLTLALTMNSCESKILGQPNPGSTDPLLDFPAFITPTEKYFETRIGEMELLKSGVVDYWSLVGWDTDSSMAVDSKIFFPANDTRVTLGDSIRIGAATYGGRRISLVEIIVDEGN